MKDKRIFCLLCAEEKGLIVGFPDRAKSPWNRLKVPSRIDHLKYCHFINADFSNYDKYFAHDVQEIVEYLQSKFEKGQQK